MCKRLAKNADAARARERIGWNGKWSLPDDGYIDQIAVHLAAYGIRNVRLTPPEQTACVEKMIHMNLNAGDMATRLGVLPPRLHMILDELGWEVIRDPHISTRATLVTRKNRPPKVLDYGLVETIPTLPRNRRKKK